MIESLQLTGLASFAPTWWPFSATSKDQDEAAYQLTMLPVYKRQLEGLRAKLDAARARGQGQTPAYTDASYKVMVAEQKFDEVHSTALQWYERAQQAGKVRPLDESLNGGLAGRGVLTIVIGVALVVVGVVGAVAAAPFVATCAALVGLIGAATAAVGALSVALPPEHLSTIAGSGAIIAALVFGILVLSRLRGAR